MQLCKNMYSMIIIWKLTFRKNILSFQEEILFTVDGYFSKACNFRNLANLGFRKHRIKSTFSRSANAQVLSTSTQFLQLVCLQTSTAFHQRKHVLCVLQWVTCKTINQSLICISGPSPSRCGKQPLSRVIVFSKGHYSLNWGDIEPRCIMISLVRACAVVQWKHDLKVFRKIYIFGFFWKIP